MENKKRADQFLQEISPKLKEYEYKWRTYFKEIDLPFDIDVLHDTVLKCYDTISRLGLKQGEKESLNYLFKAFKMNSIRELQYARNKNRDEVEDIGELHKQFMNNQKSAGYKIVSDLWTEFQVDYITRMVELYFDKQCFYLFKLKYILQADDDKIRKKTRNPNWKKDLKYITKWLKANIDRKDIIREFNKKYPEVDLEVLSN